MTVLHSVLHIVKQWNITAASCRHITDVARAWGPAHIESQHTDSYFKWITEWKQTQSQNYELLFYQQHPHLTVTFFTSSQPRLIAGWWSRTADLLLADIHLCRSVGVHTHLQLRPINVRLPLQSVSGRPHGGICWDVTGITPTAFPYTSASIH